MSQHQRDQNEEPGENAEDQPVGGLDPAPTTPTEDKSEPEAGTGSADKRSRESLAEQDEPASGASGETGSTGGDVTR